MTLTAGDSQNCKHKKCRVSFFSVCFLHLLRQQSEGRNIKSNKAEQPKPVKILGLITTCTLKYQAGYHIVISASVSKYVVGYPKIYINLEIRKRKFRWIGYTLRKEDGEIPNAALHWNPQGNRKRGIRKNSWRSVIKEAGRSWNELSFLAADRSGKDSQTTYAPRRNDGLNYYYYIYIKLILKFLQSWFFLNFIFYPIICSFNFFLLIH